MIRAMVVLRSFAFGTAASIWTLSFAPLIPVLWLMGLPERIIRPLTRFWARGVLSLLGLIAGIRFSHKRRYELPAEPALIIANHQSPWETVAALVLFPDVAIVTKRELLGLPVIGWFLRYSPMIPVDRGQSASALRAMLTACQKEVAAGRSVLIFPEGTRKAPGSPIVLKRGVDLLHRYLAIPVVIFAHNSGRFWRKGLKLHPGNISVLIQVADSPPSDRTDFLQKTERRLENEVAALDQWCAVAQGHPRLDTPT